MKLKTSGGKQKENRKMKGKEKEGVAYATCCKQQNTGPKACQLEKW